MENRRQLSKETVKSVISKAIIEKELLPGERIIETKIARELNVSQAPVREALRDLEHLGIIESEPYRGAFVRGITREDMYNSYKMRMFLEHMAIDEGFMYVNEETIESIEDSLNEMEKSAAENALESYIEHDSYFHKAILGLSNNNILQRVWEHCDFRDLVRLGTVISGENLIILARRHNALRIALKSGDKKLAFKESEKHWQMLMDMFDTELF